MSTTTVTPEKHILAHENGSLIIVTLVSRDAQKTIVQEDQGTTRFTLRHDAGYRQLFSGASAVEDAMRWQSTRRVEKAAAVVA